MEKFHTTDLGVASYLVYLDYEPELKQLSIGRIDFVFMLPEEKSDEIISGYWGGHNLVHPRKFYNAVKSVKNYIYQRKIDNY